MAMEVEEAQVSTAIVVLENKCPLGKADNSAEQVSTTAIIVQNKCLQEPEVSTAIQVVLQENHNEHSGKPIQELGRFAFEQGQIYIESTETFDKTIEDVASAVLGKSIGLATKAERVNIFHMFIFGDASVNGFDDCGGIYYTMDKRKHLVDTYLYQIYNSDYCDKYIQADVVGACTRKKKKEILDADEKPSNNNVSLNKPILGHAKSEAHFLLGVDDKPKTIQIQIERVYNKNRMRLRRETKNDELELEEKKADDDQEEKEADNDDEDQGKTILDGSSNVLEESEEGSQRTRGKKGEKRASLPYDDILELENNKKKTKKRKRKKVPPNRNNEVQKQIQNIGKVVNDLENVMQNLQKVSPEDVDKMDETSLRLLLLSFMSVQKDVIHFCNETKQKFKVR